ncbi:MAG: hypothetical protein KC588_18800 [Nitrospira sp.]|nr:hypothetical protein [Nitrospira sp.]
MKKASVTKTKKGTSLEQLIRSLERALSPKKDIKIESPKRFPDKTTGKLREHDVVLTVEHGHHPLIIAIECRDRSRPITVDQVEGFWAKCQHTGINQWSAPRILDQRYVRFSST